MMLIVNISAADFKPVLKLIDRQIPWLSGKIRFEDIKSQDGHDVFELSSSKGKIVIKASGVNAAAAGLNYYLKNYCNRSMSHLGDNLQPVSQLPKVMMPVRKVDAFPVRYALNYCTINYTMSFYGWKEWERELDWMALNGINLMLMPVGTEIVWQQTLRRFGFSDEEILEFLPGHAFTAWWLMGNLEGWGGPLTQNMIDEKADLARKILKRMNELGIEPVTQGFYGMVPVKLKEKLDVKVIEQGSWAGGFIRPDFLLPEDPVFEKMAAVYYEAMKSNYGSDIHYFGGEPFHEGGRTGGADVSRSAALIQQQMLKYYPSSTWVLQGWQSNPSKELLGGLEKSKTLVIELFGENTANWERRNGYENTPFVWAHVSNFGEKTGLYGRLQRFADEVYRARTSNYGRLMKGVGFIPEGIDNNPPAYELMADLAWQNQKMNVNDWIKGYILSRYGVTTPKLEKAWELLLQTAYSSPLVYQEGPSESVFCARPALEIHSVSSWGTRKRNYDTSLFEIAVKLFVEAGDEIGRTETYLADRTDFVRQLLANRADGVYAQMVKAVEQKNRKQFADAYDKFEYMLMQQDSLLNSSRFFSLSSWLNQAKSLSKDKAEQELLIRNAKTQISYWGPDNPVTDLHDYAHKEWGGLLGSLYLERWRMFKQAELAKMDGNDSNENYFGIEKQWADSSVDYPMLMLSPQQIDELIERILVEQ